MGGCVCRLRERRARNGPREEQLLLLPGRFFANYQQSTTTPSSIFTQQGRKGINQDSMILWEGFAGGVLCGVFDGHGPQGHLVSRKVRDALPLKLLAFLPLTATAHTAGFLCFGTARRSVAPSAREPSLSAWREALVRSYKAMDKVLRSQPTLDCFCSGSTAVTLLKIGSNLYIGNLGDSRAILASKDESGSSLVAVQLTIDLKPDLPNEAERIKQCKGRVFALQEEPEVPRVWLPFDDAPGLAMARAFGDFCLKDYGVISVPEFSHWTLTEKDQFVVLASDGVWDVYSNQEVVDIIASSPSRSSAAKFLIDAAAREWKIKYPTSRMDDCTVVCLYFDGQMDVESESRDNGAASTTICSPDPQSNEVNRVQDQEPSLNRNLTVRSKENRDCASGVYDVGDDQNWSGLEGVTRVNSLVRLPRFSDKKSTD